MNRLDRATLWTIAVGAVLLAALRMTGTVATALEAAGSDPVEVDRMSTVNAATPVFTESLAAVTDARYESATLTVSGLPAGTRWLLWGSGAADALVVIGICLALVWLCVQVGRQRPFGRSIIAALMAASILIMVGGVASQLLAAFGRAEVTSFLGPQAVGDPSAGAEAGAEHLPAFLLDLDLTPFGIGIALAVVVVAFQIGARLQRDVEGLV